MGPTGYQRDRAKNENGRQQFGIDVEQCHDENVVEGDGRRGSPQPTAFGGHGAEIGLMCRVGVGFDNG